MLGLDSTLDVASVLERREGQHLDVNVERWHSLQHDSKILNAIYHLFSCFDRRLGEVLMPELGRVQGH